MKLRVFTGHCSIDQILDPDDFNTYPHLKNFPFIYYFNTGEVYSILSSKIGGKNVLFAYNNSIYSALKKQRVKK